MVLDTSWEGEMALAEDEPHGGRSDGGTRGGDVWTWDHDGRLPGLP